MTEPTVTVLIWVTHLLGTGHLFRTAAIARALRRRGARVVVASGGMAVRGVDLADAEFHQLPPVRSPDATFHALVGIDGAPVEKEFMDRRATLLSGLMAQTKPDVILTELYPFGRRKFRSEVDRLLDEAAAMAPRPSVVASVRDIPAPPSNESQVDFAVTRLSRHYDMVLVHGDPNFVTLDRTFPLPETLSPLCRYTGYIGGSDGRTGDAGNADGTDEIVVSAGGGVVGQALYQAAIDASAQGDLRRRRWRVLVGRNMSPATFDRLSATAGENVTVEWARPDFPALLRRAAVSISQAGYNTVADILAAEVPAVLVPFADSGEEEQTIRAHLMAEAGRAVVLKSEHLSALSLAAAVAAALVLAPDTRQPIAMNGDDRSADLIVGLARRSGDRHG